MKMNYFQTLFKGGIYNIASKDVEELYRYAKSAEIISFDVFDTLIKRNVANPQDVFLLTEYQFNMHQKSKKTFYRERIDAEARARKKSTTNEVTLGDIYNELDGFTQLEKGILENLELKIEKDICCPHLPMKEFYNWCQSNGKKLVLISDMYLDSGQIKGLLFHCGYKVENLFVSCEYGCSKTDGGLYKLVMEKMGDRTENWIHIGDSIKADYIMSRKNGILSMLIKRDMKQPLYYKDKVRKRVGVDNKLFFDINRSFIENHEWNEISDYARIGYEILGPILFWFSQWLHENVVNREYDKILFLSRDSKILKEAYEIVFPEKSKDNVYFYTSRKAATNAVVDLLNSYQEMHDLFVPKDSATVYDLYNAIHVHERVMTQIEESLGITRQMLINSNAEINTADFFEILKANSLLDSERQRELLLEYIRNIGVDHSFAIVDIGWEGRTEWAFKRAVSTLNKKMDIDGYYIGIISKCPDIIKSINAYSFWGKLKSTDRHARVIMESVALFENLFLTSEGSTIGYETNNYGEIVPVKLEPDQVEENRKKIEELQNAALEFVKVAFENKLAGMIPVIPETLFEVYADFAIRPTQHTVRLLRELKFRDDGIQKIGTEHNLLFYMFHPAKLVRDTWKSYYRVLFLKDLFKLPLPYFDILFAIYKKKHKHE